MSEPMGASVYRRDYGASDDSWVALGTTPIEHLRLPRDVAMLRFDLSGYETVLRLSVDVANPLRTLMASSGQAPELNISVQLDSSGSLPSGKVRIPAWNETVEAQATEFRDYFLDRYEVTNREYKAFVDAGGYERKEYWEHPFKDGSKTLSWDEAMSRFVDQTGRPGPSTWVGGSYPNGEPEFPVSGVSWYEAAAYAKFAGEELPTVYHWRHAVIDLLAFLTLPASNLEGNGPAPVGRYVGVNWAGTFDMAGNVREWAFNEIDDNRVMLGGGWSDPRYQGIVAEGASQYGQPPMDRSAINGFRTAVIRDPALEFARMPLEPADHLPDWDIEKPVADDVFAAYQRVYDYDDGPLNESIDARSVADNWTRERVSFDSAYGDDRVIVNLYLPKNAAPPYQTVVWWPGADAFFIPSSERYFPAVVSLFTDNGRAVALPVLNKTFERRDGNPLPSRNSNAFRQLTIQWVNDIRQTLNYLDTRADIDTSDYAYLGMSWGGANAPNVLALEDRFEVAVLVVGGMLSAGNEAFQAGRELPEVYAVNALPRVKLPVLMLNGEYDSIVPLATSAIPFFELLGTPGESKKHVIEPGTHFLPMVTVAQQTLNWLDAYMGVPRRRDGS